MSGIGNTAPAEPEDVPPAPPVTEPDPERPVYYIEIGLSPSVADPSQLVFIAAPRAPTPPRELVALRQEYGKTARVTSVLFRDEKPVRRQIFLMLHRAADRAFRGPDFSVEDGQSNLDEVREAITDFAITIRQKRLWQYTRQAIFFGLIPLILGAIVLRNCGPGALKTGDVYDQLFGWIMAAFWIPAGAAICLCGEFGLRMMEVPSYDQLMNLDPGRWRPGERLVITIGIAFIFAFLLAYKAVQVGLGSLLLNEFIDKTPAYALAIGGITALAFASVRDIIYRIKPEERR